MMLRRSNSTVLGQFNLAAAPMANVGGIASITPSAGTFAVITTFSSATDTWEIRSQGGSLLLGPHVLLGPSEAAPDASQTPYIKMNRNVAKANKLAQLGAFVVTFSGVAPPPPTSSGDADRFMGAGMFGSRSPWSFPTKYNQVPNTLVETDAIILKGLAGFSNIYYTYNTITRLFIDAGFQLSVNNGPWSSEVNVVENDSVKARKLSRDFGETAVGNVYCRSATTVDDNQILGIVYIHSRNNYRAPITRQIGPTRTVKDLDEIPLRANGYYDIAEGDVIELDNGAEYGIKPNIENPLYTLTGVNQTGEYIVKPGETTMCCYVLSDYPAVFEASIVFEALIGSTWSGTQSTCVRNGEVKTAGTPWVGTAFTPALRATSNDPRITDGYRVVIPASATKLRIKVSSYVSGNIYASWYYIYKDWFTIKGGGTIDAPVKIRGVGPGARAIIQGGGSPNHSGVYEATIGKSGPYIDIENVHIRAGYGGESTGLRIGGFGNPAEGGLIKNVLVDQSRNPVLTMDEGTGAQTYLLSEFRDSDNLRFREFRSHNLYAAINNDQNPASRTVVKWCYLNNYEGNALKFRGRATAEQNWITSKIGVEALQPIGFFGAQGSSRSRSIECVSTGNVIVVKNIPGPGPNSAQSFSTYFTSVFGDGTSIMPEGKVRIEKNTFVMSQLDIGFNVGAVAIGKSFLALNNAIVCDAPSPSTPYRIFDDFGGEFSGQPLIRFEGNQIAPNYEIKRQDWSAAAVFVNNINGKAGITASNVNAPINVMPTAGSPLLNAGRNLATYVLPVGYETAEQKRDFSVGAWATEPVSGSILVPPTTVGSASNIGAI